MTTDFEQTASSLFALRNAGNDDALRETIGTLLFSFEQTFPSPTAHEIERLCLRLLRESDNRRNAQRHDGTFYGCDVGALLEHASLASDVLLSDAGRSLCFTGDPLLCGADPTLLLCGYLNLVANAVQYGEEDVFAVLRQDGDGALLSVESLVSAPLPTAFHTGLRCAANAARLHGGRLLLSACGERLCAVMRFQTSLPWETLFTPPRFSQYLQSRVSPLQIALCQVLP